MDLRVVVLLLLMIPLSHGLPIGTLKDPSYLRREVPIDNGNYLEVIIALTARVVTPESEEETQQQVRGDDKNTLPEGLKETVRRDEGDDELWERFIQAIRRDGLKYMNQKDFE